MTADSLSVPNDIDDQVPTKVHVTKTVEGRLGETLKKLAVTEANLYFLSTLKKLGLSSNDVTNFV